MYKAIVTLAIGKKYQERWQATCKKNWSQYAEKHGYDIICISEPLDESKRAETRSPAWQKCLVLGHEKVKRYHQVVWIDSDVLLNPYAPCIISQVSEPQKVGAVEMFSGPLSETFPSTSTKLESLADRSKSFWSWPFRTGKEFYRNVGLSDDFSEVVQTGVMVLSPKFHRDTLEYAYYKHEHQDGQSFEMECLSYELVKANLVNWLDHRFNRLWAECILRDYPFLLPPEPSKNKIIRHGQNYLHRISKLSKKTLTDCCISTALINNYFLHFAGTAQFMNSFKPCASSWQQLRGRLQA
ncbi:hypothetical protein H6F75_10915 [Nodosilinea sp. FACHB-131]|uniref:hypothetical protein n=1 Tax=Cyanophyceae TaxID=3028117 RepID=UPI0016847FE5|nr:hypothetical protein [Nodosilinea sp. FACHB-131]MBD1873997.1 hypothetical protein [Nodosilinea sp. FACHB-131]